MTSYASWPWVYHVVAIVDREPAGGAAGMGVMVVVVVEGEEEVGLTRVERVVEELCWTKI